MNYYRRYSGDYLRDTARLSMLEHGAYCLMLDYYYSEEQPLPLDLNEIYTMVRAMTPADRKAVDKVLGKYFEQQDDGYHNNRADKEIEVSQKARTNGKGGGRPPKSGTGTETGLTTGSGTGQQTGTETEDVTGEGGGLVHPPTTNHQPPTTSLQPTPKNAAAASISDPIFGECLEFLQRKGVHQDHARSFLTLMRKSYGDEQTIEVFREAERLDITQPKAWISKALSVRSTSSKGGESQTTKAMKNLQAMKATLR